jgi:hypothetical protein
VTKPPSACAARFHGMEEVVSSNLTRSTKFLKHLQPPVLIEPVDCSHYQVQIRSKNETCSILSWYSSDLARVPFYRCDYRTLGIRGGHGAHYLTLFRSTKTIVAYTCNTTIDPRDNCWQHSGVSSRSAGASAR